MFEKFKNKMQTVEDLKPHTLMIKKYRICTLEDKTTTVRPQWSI